jgi:hypothetical protein
MIYYPETALAPLSATRPQQKVIILYHSSTKDGAGHEAAHYDLITRQQQSGTPNTNKNTMLDWNEIHYPNSDIVQRLTRLDESKTSKQHKANHKQYLPKTQQPKVTSPPKPKATPYHSQSRSEKAPINEHRSTDRTQQHEHTRPYETMHGKRCRFGNRCWSITKVKPHSCRLYHEKAPANHKQENRSTKLPPKSQPTNSPQYPERGNRYNADTSQPESNRNHPPYPISRRAAYHNKEIPCRNGDQCAYLHAASGPRCRFYHDRKHMQCRRGDSCPYNKAHTCWFAHYIYRPKAPQNPNMAHMATSNSSHEIPGTDTQMETESRKSHPSNDRRPTTDAHRATQLREPQQYNNTRRHE